MTIMSNHVNMTVVTSNTVVISSDNNRFIVRACLSKILILTLPQQQTMGIQAQIHVKAIFEQGIDEELNGIDDKMAKTCKDTIKVTMLFHILHLHLLKLRAG